MKRIIIFIGLTIICLQVCFGANYVIHKQDENNANGIKYYGIQLEQSTVWRGWEVVTDTTTLQVETNYVMGISTTTFYDWWDVHDSTTTVYYDGFSYQKQENIYT